MIPVSSLTLFLSLAVPAALPPPTSDVPEHAEQKARAARGERRARACVERLDAAACHAALATRLPADRAAEIRMFLLLAERSEDLDEQAPQVDPEKVVRAVTRANPQNALAWYRLGGLLQYSAPDASAEAYRRAIALKPEWIAAYEGLASALQNARKYAEEADVLHEAVRRLPGDAHLLSDLGLTLISTERWVEAVAVLRSLSESGHATYKDWMGLAGALMKSGQKAQGVTAYKGALAAATTLEDRTFVGYRLREADEWGAAADAFRRAVEALEAEGFRDDSGAADLEMARRFKDLSLDCIQALERAGRTGDAQRARDALIQTLAADARSAPDRADGWTLLGDALLSLKRHGEALEAYRKAAGLEHGGIPPALGVVAALVGLGRPDEAAAAVTALLAEHPKDVALMATAVSLFESAGQIDDALALRRRMFEQFSLYSGQYLLDIPRPDYAVLAERYRAAADANPTDPVPEAALAVALGWLQRYAEANAARRRAIDRSPATPWPHALLGCYVWNERPEEALQEFARVDRLDPTWIDAHPDAKHCREQAMTVKKEGE